MADHPSRNLKNCRTFMNAWLLMLPSTSWPLVGRSWCLDTLYSHKGGLTVKLLHAGVQMEAQEAPLA